MDIASLWLPILASGAAVFFASFIAWAVSPHHHGDYQKVHDESALDGAIKSLGLTPGSYAFPHCADSAKRKDPEFNKRWKEGPTGTIAIGGQMSMGRNMALTFLVFLISSTLIAYLATLALPAGSDFARVFRVTGTAGILAYTISFLPNAIWFCMPKRAIAMNLIDGIVYGLITGAVFGALWPEALGAVTG
ncbi:MAG: hypothetical protein H7Y88_07555 [Phycisphaerales bacterium]|nr:hypothetical protein [Phycisphaerales bacterium]